MKIRINLANVPSLLFVGFKKELGDKGKQPVPFLFFAPDVPKQNSYWLQALAKAEGLLNPKEVLLAVDPAEFAHSAHGLARITWDEFYNTSYAKSEHDIERMSLLLKQVNRQGRQLGTTLTEQVVADAIEAGRQQGDELSDEEAEQILNESTGDSSEEPPPEKPAPKKTTVQELIAKNKAAKAKKPVPAPKKKPIKKGTR